MRANYVGVFPKGELAISCPHWSSLSALNVGSFDGGRNWWEVVGIGSGGREDGRGDEGEHGKGDKGENGRWQEGKGNGAKMLEIPAELRQRARPQFVAAVWIATQYLLGEGSFWARYFDILPGLPEVVPAGAAQAVPGLRRGLGELDTPLWWDEEERGWLQNTNLAKGIADLEGVWTEEWKRWASVVEAWGEETRVHVTW